VEENASRRGGTPHNLNLRKSLVGSSLDSHNDKQMSPKIGTVVDKGERRLLSDKQKIYIRGSLRASPSGK